MKHKLALVSIAALLTLAWINRPRRTPPPSVTFHIRPQRLPRTDTGPGFGPR